MLEVTHWACPVPVPGSSAEVAPVRGDGARDVGEITLDALRRQAAGPIGVHHDRDVTVLEPEGQALSHAWSPGTARAGIPQERVEIMSGGPSAVLRPFSGAGRPCAFTTAPPETREDDSEMVLRRGIDRTAAVAVAGPPVRLRWAWLTLRTRSGMRARRLGRGRGGRVSGGRA